MIPPGPDIPWFLVLPDVASGRAVEAVAVERGAGATRAVDHPSGRRWLLGSWADGAVTVARAGDTALALVGRHGTTEQQLAAAAARVRTRRRPRPARGVPGRQRAPGRLGGRPGAGAGHRDRAPAGLHRDRCGVAGGRGPGRRARPAGRGGAGRAAGSRCTCCTRTSCTRSPGCRSGGAWTRCRGDSYLVLDGTEPAHRPLVAPAGAGAADGRGRARAAGRAGRCGRLPGPPAGSWSAATSAGWTRPRSAALAARGDATLVAYTAANRDPLADDVAWAERTVAGLPRRRAPRHPGRGDAAGVRRPGASCVDRFDEPCSATVDGARWLAIVRRAADRGSRLHLTGFGGDELLYGSVAHLQDMLRTSPRTGLRALRGFAAKYRWPRRAVLRQLADTRPYGRWLAGVADTVTAPPPAPNEPLLEWGFRPRLPPWAGRDGGRGGAGRDPGRGRRRRAAVAAARPAAGAGDHALPVPDDPAARPGGRPARRRARRAVLRRPGDRGRARRAGGGPGHAVARTSR